MIFPKKCTHTSSTLIRILLFSFVVLTAFTGPWWLSFGTAVVLILFFKFYEALFAGVVLDILFAGEGYSFFVGDFVFSSILLCMVSFSLLFLQRFRTINTF